MLLNRYNREFNRHVFVEMSARRCDRPAKRRGIAFVTDDHERDLDPSYCWGFSENKPASGAVAVPSAARIAKLLW